MSTPMKACKRCGSIKPATPEFFSPRKDSRDKLAYHCRSCDAEHAREWNAQNRKRKTELQRAWRKAHPGYVAKKSKAWREAHPEKQRAYIESYRERAAENRRAAYAANPEHYATLARRIRARKHGAEGNHTVEDIKAIYEAQDGRCHYCNVTVGDDYHVDHVIPLTRGGNNDPSNLVIACPTCNQSKGNKLPSEWIGAEALP